MAIFYKFAPLHDFLAGLFWRLLDIFGKKFRKIPKIIPEIHQIRPNLLYSTTFWGGSGPHPDIFPKNDHFWQIYLTRRGFWPPPQNSTHFWGAPPDIFPENFGGGTPTGGPPTPFGRIYLSPRHFWPKIPEFWPYFGQKSVTFFQIYLSPRHFGGSGGPFLSDFVDIFPEKSVTFFKFTFLHGVFRGCRGPNMGHLGDTAGQRGGAGRTVYGSILLFWG